MITLELAQEFLHNKNFKIYSPHSHWVKEYKVMSVSIRNFGYDEWVFRCEYWDCGLLQSVNVTAPISQFNSWLEERREKQILELV
jgi:hypothetical protein